MKALQGEGELIRQVRSELAKAAEFSFGMALIKRSGLDLILNVALKMAATEECSLEWICRRNRLLSKSFVKLKLSTAKLLN
jgi:hypothetical protein